jgi:hypothetical protein
MSLRSEDVIVTHSSPAVRDGRRPAAIAIGALMHSTFSLRAELAGIRRYTRATMQGR